MPPRSSHWATNPLNIAIRIKTNMNRGGAVQDVWIDGVTLPNGVTLVGKGYGASNMVAGSPITAAVPVGMTSASGSNPAASQGGLITFDCDYSPAGDAVRVSPPVVKNINISNVTASNATTGGATASCFQAIVAQGPVAADYNGLGANGAAYQWRHDFELRSRNAGLQWRGFGDKSWTDLRQ